MKHKVEIEVNKNEFEKLLEVSRSWINKESKALKMLAIKVKAQKLLRKFSKFCTYVQVCGVYCLSNN